MLTLFERVTQHLAEGTQSSTVFFPTVVIPASGRNVNAFATYLDPIPEQRAYRLHAMTLQSKDTLRSSSAQVGMRAAAAVHGSTPGGRLTFQPAIRNARHSHPGYSYSVQASTD